MAQGAGATQDLVSGLTHPNPNVRWWCLQILDHSASDQCVPAIFELLHDPVWRVRRMAVHALSCQRCKPTPLSANMKDVLIDIALHDPCAKTRGEAIFGLLNYASDTAIIAALQHIIAEFEAIKAQGSLSKSQWGVLRGARFTLKRHTPHAAGVKRQASVSEPGE